MRFLNGCKTETKDSFTHCEPETPILVIWQTVKTQMNGISSVLFAKTKSIFRGRNTVFLEIIICASSGNFFEKGP